MLKETPIKDDIIVKLSNKKDSTKKLGRILAVVSLVSTLVLLSMYGILKAKILGPTTTGLREIRLPVDTVDWNGIATDPEKEEIEFSIAHPGLEYFVAVNGGFSNPKLFPDKSGNGSLGKGVTNIYYLLRTKQRLATSEMVITKKPKK